MNIGFVTNSSFAVHHFPKQLLNHPGVKAFIELFEVSRGFVGDDMWTRSMCGTLAVTKEQKKQVVDKFKREQDEFFRPPHIDVESDDVVIIYGDEYASLAHQISNLMREAAEEMGLSVSTGDYH